MTTSPYADAYNAYWTAGWRGILPLPYQKKTYPPEGFTGYNGVNPSYADCTAWADDGPRNICLRLDPSTVGIDVDHYDDKTGGHTFNDLVAKYGPLPRTWLSTSRDDGISGIRIYRIPVGTTLPTKLPGIEFVQHHHRYAVVAPSVHPNGRTYQWINEADGSISTDPPALADIPELPHAWVVGLATEARHAEKADLEAHQAIQILADMPKGEPCPHVLAFAGKALAGGDRHDSYNEAVLAVVGAGRRGCPGALATITRLHNAFIAEITAPGTGRATKSEAEAEWKRSLAGAVAIVATEEQGHVCLNDVVDWIIGNDTAVVNPDDQADDSELPPEPTPFDVSVNRRYAELRISEAAKEMLAAHKAGEATPLAPISLADFLSQPDEAERYRVDQLWPAEGRVLLAAAAKSGKTTLVTANLIPALVDGRDFLDRYDVQPVTGRIALFNMEVGERTLRNWMRRASIHASDAVALFNLRGKSSALTLGSDAGRKRFAGQLRDLEVEVAILDPLAPVLASLGLDENSNADVAQFFAWWSETLALAGVADDVVVHHTGHAGDRSRGASRLLDEPDAIWTLTKDKDREGDEDDPIGHIGPRYLSAYGRDVELPESSLAFDRATGHLSLTGLGKRETRRQASDDAYRKAIIGYLQVNGAAVKTTIADNVTGRREALLAVINAMVEAGELDEIQDGGKYKLTLPNALVPDSSRKFPPFRELAPTGGSQFPGYREPGVANRNLELIVDNRGHTVPGETGTTA